MRIAVNTRFLITGKMEGFGWYTHEVFKRIVAQHPEHEFIFIFDRDYDNAFVYGPNVTAVKAGPKARHPWLFYWWFEKVVPRILKKHKAQLFVSPDGYMSLRTNIPQIAVIHDLNFEHYPNDLKPHIIRYYKKYFPLFAKKADHILTVSEFSKNDIAKTYQIDPEKITVGYNSADESFKKSANIIDLRKKFSLENDYFLSVGSIHARKNIERLLLAFDKFRQNTQKKVNLVLVGNKYNWTTSMNKTFEGMKFKNDVIFAGHLTREDLVKAYSGAKALVFPSYFEGFGIPLIEAMQCECPVICSNATCFPEVAANAAVYFNAFDVDDMAKTMHEFYIDSALERDLIEKGKKRAADFSWDKTAEIVWSVIEKTARAKKIL
ncbi:MAG TPA: glycosyltransferase family 1 protein [Flavobacteriales bacterium]|nr:glycosyltransferase family 1 protein [Flavobacteriales bacterium]